MSWHVSPSTLLTYVNGECNDSDAWSVEAHLVTCENCRVSLASIAAADGSLDSAWESLAARLPVQGQARPGSRSREVRVLVASGPAARVSWLVACALVFVVALLAGSPEGSNLSPWLGVFAPAVVVLGVAVSYGAGLDDSYEIIASTSNGGLRLVLIRTVSVLVVTIPIGLVAGVLVGYGSPVPWLGATLGLTLLSLAVGSVIGVTRAAIIVGAVWTLAAGAPLFGDAVSVLLTTRAVPAWLAVATVAAAVIVSRRGSFHQFPLKSGQEVPS